MSILDPSEQKAAEAATEAGILPAAQYKCRIVGVERWKSGTSLVWKFRIEKDQPGAGREVWDWTGLTERGVFKTKERFDALGVALDAEEKELLGVPVTVAVEPGINDATGEPKNKIVSVARGEGEAVTPPEPDEDAGIPF